MTANGGITLTADSVKIIEQILHRRNQAEIKIEHGEVVILEVRKTKRSS